MQADGAGGAIQCSDVTTADDHFQTWGLDILYSDSAEETIGAGTGKETRSQGLGSLHGAEPFSTESRQTARPTADAVVQEQ